MEMNFIFLISVSQREMNLPPKTLVALVSLTFAVTLTILLQGLVPEPVNAKEYSIGIREESKLVPAKIVDSPAPEIPASLQETAFKSYCEARFVIDAKGGTTVSIVSSSGSEEIDAVALQTLKKWKFKPATLEGEPTSSTRRIKVEFEVE